MTDETPVLRCENGHEYSAFFSSSALGYLSMIDACPECGAAIFMPLGPGTQSP